MLLRGREPAALSRCARQGGSPALHSAFHGRWSASPPARHRPPPLHGTLGGAGLWHPWSLCTPACIPTPAASALRPCLAPVPPTMPALPLHTPAPEGSRPGSGAGVPPGLSCHQALHAAHPLAGRACLSLNSSQLGSPVFSAPAPCPHFAQFALHSQGSVLVPAEGQLGHPWGSALTVTHVRVGRGLEGNEQRPSSAPVALPLHVLARPRCFRP